MNIAVFGAKGRVGKRVAALAETDGYTVLKIDSDNADGIFDENVDAAVDFSLPSATLQVAKFCRNHNCPLVTGVTGRNEEETRIITELGRTVPVVVSENFSQGIAALRKAAKYLKSLLPQWDCEIIEIHRAKKTDCPSGTALALAKDLCGKEEYVLHGRNVERGKETAAVHSLRCGTVFGTHTVFLAGEGETITITHNAENVDIFARGALDEAYKLINEQKSRRTANGTDFNPSEKEPRGN